MVRPGFARVVAALVFAPIVASQSARPAPVTRLAIVAYHDSRLFTLCPVFGKQVIKSDIWTNRMDAKVAVAYPPDGRQSIVLAWEPERPTRVSLPMPGAPRDGELDRLARDIGVEHRLADAFRALGHHTIVDSPANADLVLVAESTYIPMSIGLTDPPQRSQSIPREQDRGSAARIFRDADDEWNRRMNWRDDSPSSPPARQESPQGEGVVGVIGGDRHLNWRHAILAVAVPAPVFRQHPGDGTALAAGSVWSGVAAEGGGERLPTSRTRSAASPEVLASQFHANVRLPEYLPICGATAGPIRSVEDAPDERPGQPAQHAGDPPSAVPPVSQAESGRPRFTSSITLVTVPVTVTGPDGAPVSNLPLSALRVFEDEVEQKVDRLDPGTLPADIAVIVDTSGSMRAPRDAIRRLAPALAQAVRAADRVMIVSIDRRIRVLADFTRDPDAIERALAASNPGGGTRLYDGLALVAVDRLRQVDGRKAIVLLTDGADTTSQLTNADGALAAIESSNTTVFAVQYDMGAAGAFPLSILGVKRWLVAPDSPEKVGEAREAAGRFLARLTAGTGGRLYIAQPEARVPEILADIADQLSRQVILGYSPSNTALDGTLRRIRVAVECDGCTVRNRTGYRAGAR